MKKNDFLKSKYLAPLPLCVSLRIFLNCRWL